MMWEEFEQLAGYEVTHEDYYNVIEPMYNAVTLSKSEFIETLDRKRFDKNLKMKNLLKEIRKIAKERKENCEFFCNYEALHEMDELIEEYKGLRFPGLKVSHYLEMHHWKSLEHACTYPAAIEFWITDTNHDLDKIKIAE